MKNKTVMPVCSKHPKIVGKKMEQPASAMALYATGDQTGAGSHERLTPRHHGFQEHTQEKVRPA